jgi:hypothetical protein
MYGDCIMYRKCVCDGRRMVVVVVAVAVMASMRGKKTQQGGDGSR